MDAFDAWDTELMHWGIFGMKHGQRRYQNPDGTWTQEGLERRRERERKALEKQARSSRRTKRLKDMTDEELRQGIARANLEKEYREATKNPTWVAISDAIGKYAEYRANKYNQAKEKRNDDLRELSYITDQIKARYGYKSEKERTKQTRNKKTADKAKLIETKAKNTIFGAIRAGVAKILSGSLGKVKFGTLQKGIQNAEDYNKYLDAKIKMRDLENQLDEVEDYDPTYTPKHAKKKQDN